MGSSRKSGDKDKERDRETRKKRKRERSNSRERKRDRSRSKDRGRERSKSRDRGRERSKSRDRGRERSKSRDRGRERSKSRDRGRERSKSRDRGRERSKSRDRGRERSNRREESTIGKGSSSGDISLSIDETNKLRISLGLKPLEVGGATSEVGGASNKEGEVKTDETTSVMKKDAIHAPPKNIGQIKAADTLKEKLAVRKETRKINKVLSSIKTLGEEDGDNDNVDDSLLWVQKMRRMEEEKKKAEKKAQMLSEMDEEFGIGDIISEVVLEDKKKAYGSHDLSGIKVEHDASSFKEGRDTTLVIKDTGILEEGEDVLLNLNMVETEMAVKNVELKKGKPGYNPYEEEEVDELGNLRKQDLLKKYNEEIDGEKKKMFTLGEGGAMDTSVEREREIIRQKLLDKRITLETAPFRQASEYFTPEEMVQFKKPKKKRKLLRKKEKIKADDLMPLGKEDSTRDHGSRSRHGDTEDMDVDVSDLRSGDDLKDEADSHVDNSLTRTRRLHNRPLSEAANVGAAKVITLLKNVKREEEVEGEGLGDGDVIVLDTTAEFCKQVGEDDAGGDDPSSMDAHHGDEYHGNNDDDMDIDEEGGWTEVKGNYEKKKAPQFADLYQEAEPMVASGVAATLQLAAQKGFVSSRAPEKKKLTTESSTARRDIEYERQKEKERDRELSRFGRESSFPEKKSYVPNVRIEYMDDNGRILNTKEAFRHMSHKFHGRGSGRKKLEKRLKKIQDEHLLNTTSSTDTPLNMLSVLKTKQKASQSPYILISGGAQSLLAPDIAKRK